MIYLLKQYDLDLIEFKITHDELNQYECNIINFNKQYKHLLPPSVNEDSKSLLKWIKNRTIPKNRENVDQILSSLGLNYRDTLGILNICKGLSLNDSYWIVEKGFKGLFKDYNLYDNKFDKTLSLLAYTGDQNYTNNNRFISSPEFTTNGMIKKGWRRLDNKIVLYKAGTSGMSNTGREPYSELYASMIAKKMGLNHVDYTLSKWKGNVCSRCELFTDINTSFFDMYSYISNKTIIEVGDYLKELNNNIYDSFIDMIIFDCLICNEDRHYGNFGLLVDNKTNKPISLAPIFDNGLSLFNYGTDNDFKDLNKYASTRLSKYDIDFIVLCKKFITDRQKEQLRKLINFKFNRNTTYKYNEDKLKAIEEYIQQRVKLFLSFKSN